MPKKSTKSSQTNLHKIFGTVKTLEENGAWVMVNEMYGLRIRVRRLNSDKAVKAYEKITQELFGEMKLRKPEDLDTNQSLTILKRQLAESVLVDWEGVYDENGQEIPYSTEAALGMMEMKDFREFVYQAASERETFREKLDENAVKN